MGTAASRGALAGASAVQVPQGYRPSQWASAPMVLITVPAGGSAGSAQSVDKSGAIDSSGNLVFSVSSTYTPPKSYVFDAVLSLEHNQTLTKTQHPIQTGAAVSSHAYLNPAQLVFYVLMSDVVGSYTGGANQANSPYIQAWSGNPSKSVSAYQQMLTLQAQRTPLTITTRLRTYSNMVVLSVAPREDDKTITGARFRVEFEQIFIANTQVVATSARPNDTNSTGIGAVSAATPSTTTQNQFGVPPQSTTNKLSPLPPTPAPQPTKVAVPGAGSYSSTPQQFGAGFGGGSEGAGASGSW